MSKDKKTRVATNAKKKGTKTMKKQVKNTKIQYQEEQQSQAFLNRLLIDDLVKGNVYFKSLNPTTICIEITEGYNKPFYGVFEIEKETDRIIQVREYYKDISFENLINVFIARD